MPVPAWIAALAPTAIAAGAKKAWSTKVMLFKERRRRRALDASIRQEQARQIVEAQYRAKRVVRYGGIPWTASDAPESMDEGNVPLCPLCYEKGIDQRLENAEESDINIRLRCRRAVHIDEPFDVWWPKHSYFEARDSDDIRKRTLSARE